MSSTPEVRLTFMRSIKAQITGIRVPSWQEKADVPIKQYNVELKSLPPLLTGKTMKNSALLVVALLSLCGISAHAQSMTPTPAPSTAATSAPSTNSQQTRMKDCAAQYHQKNIPSSGYHDFMKSCLKTGTTAKPATAASPVATPMAVASPGATPAPSQKDKMKSCNASAANQNLAGDARKSFMSSCLKK